MTGVVFPFFCVGHFNGLSDRGVAVAELVVAELVVAELVEASSDHSQQVAICPEATHLFS